MSRVAIIQPNYVPWKGYFDIIHAVDVFIFLDDVQYTVRDWRNRNKIKLLTGGTNWLSVPTKGGRNQRIDEVEIDNDQDWGRKHRESLRHNYAKSPGFKEFFPRFSELLDRRWEKLVDLDVALTQEICRWLGFERRFVRSSAMNPQGAKDDRLIDLVKKVNGRHYVSGPAARDYIRPERFAEENIGLSYFDYQGYPEYPQISQPFDHYVTVLDLVFAVGSEAPEYIWGSRRARAA
jgi:hypothetical protein